MKRTMDFSIWLKPVAGIAFAVLAGAAFLVEPGLDSWTEESTLIEYFNANAADVRWQSVLFGFAALFFVAFFALFVGVSQSRNDDATDMARTAVTSGVVLTVAILFVSQAAWLTLTEACPCVSGGDMMAGIHDKTSTLLNFSGALVAGGAALLILRSRVLLQPFGFLSLAMLALLLVNGVLQLRWPGDWDTLGDATYFLFLVWALVLAVATALPAAGAALTPASSEPTAA